ncbi:MAG: AarF/ABC1/UbiB kinase family protein [Candidatus Aminicenantes bacterium]|nr:MAG: AarF/ABC1/UbiB kinase family protein [Candidatus Aminicenantes bacterium]
MARKGTPVSELIPTRLIHPWERPPIPASTVRRKRFRFFYVVLQLFALFVGNTWFRLRGQKSALLCEKRIVKCLQRLGMLWIRVAQALSLRGSILSTSFGLRLLDLRDRGGACGIERIRETIEGELGQPLEEVFDRFEKTPFSATTVSQLHRARLRKEQVWTAVKIQQPLAEEIFDQDLTLFRRIIGLMKFFSIQTGMRWDELYHELKEIKVRELNYYYEAAALETLEQNLEGHPVHVPRVFRQYCRKRVLVMEFIQGALLSDVVALRQEDPERLEAWLKDNNIELDKVARRLFHSTYRQVFEHNFFHGDMNTNNIILLRDSHIAVIECRSAGSLEKESLEKQKMFLRALSEQEYVIAAEIYFLLATRLPRVDLNTVKERLLKVWRIWETRSHIKDLPYEQKSLAYMTGQVNQVVHDSQFAPLWSFTKLTCAWVHLDNALAVLSPGMNYLKQLRLYFRRAQRRDNFSKLRRLPSRAAASLAALQQVPKRTEEYTLFREALMRRQAQVVQGSASKVDAVIAAGFALVSFILLVVGGFFLLTFFMRYLHINLEPLLGRQLTWLASQVPDMSLGVWLLIFAAFAFLYGFFHIYKKRFSRQEFGRQDHMAAFETY